jgi:hypothetical protein
MRLVGTEVSEVLESFESHLNTRLHLAQNWILNSGIQLVNNSKNKGGFCSWYDPEKKDYPYLYPEMTGYAITALLYLRNFYSDLDSLLENRAELASNWLITRATYKCGGVKQRHSCHENPHPKNDVSYTFDAGMVLFGITNLYRVKKEAKYLNYAKKLGNFLLNMQKDDGSFYAFLDLKTGLKIDSFAKWSTQSGAFHAKLALSLLNLYEITDDVLYRESARRICEYALLLQEDDGRFITNKIKKDTTLHPHCYAVEGLLFAGNRLGNNRYLDGGKRGVEWVFSGQKENGGIPNMYYHKKGWGQFERSDVLAQVLRLGSLVLDRWYDEKLRKLITRLLSFQEMEGDLARKNGFCFGTDENGTNFNHMNCWSTMFAMQAIRMYIQRLNHKEQSISLLI